MARPNLDYSNQPAPIRGILKLYEFFASLKLAVILIFGLATILAIATFIEANLGTSAVQWYVYHTTWFMGFLGLLALNIFCAASIRFPWKHYQTGFVITHIGLLTLLAGSAVSYRGSLNSQMLVFLNGSSRTAVDRDEGYLVFNDLPGRPQPLRYKFRPGPFNWDDQQPLWHVALQNLKSQFGWESNSQSWKHSSQLVYQNDQVKVEIVDFYARSEVVEVPFVDLRFRQPTIGAELPIQLEYDARNGFAQQDFGGLGSVMFWRTQDETAWRAFTQCTPRRSVEGDGTVVFWLDGEVYHVNVARLQNLQDEDKSYELNDQISVELTAYSPRVDVQRLVRGEGLVSRGDKDGPKMPGVELKIHRKDNSGEQTFRIFRFAKYPWMPLGNKPPNFYAEFYHPAVSGRVDVLEGPDQKLAFRAWQQKAGMVVARGELQEGETVDTWSMGGGDRVWQMTLNRYVPQTQPDQSFRVLPLPFSKEQTTEPKRVKVRITSNDTQTGEEQQDEFWLKQNLPEPWASPRQRQVHETSTGSGHTIQTSYNVKKTDVGFALKLVDFDLDVDPGSTMTGNYTSHLVQIDVRNLPEVQKLRQSIEDTDDPAQKQAYREELTALTEKLIDERLQKLEETDKAERQNLIESDSTLESRLITMNRPMDYPDWQGRTLRFFQENYLPPSEARDQPLGSIFRVNYDPGRPIKYLGSLLITLGIFTMFYMRAYFFKKIPKRDTQRREKAKTAETSTSQQKEEVPV